jgi:hypothetical protein
MITVSRTQQSKLNSSLGSEKMDTKHKQHTEKPKFHNQVPAVRTPSRGVRADQVAESMFSRITKGVRTPSRGVRTDFTGFGSQTRERPDTSRVSGRISYWNLIKIEKFETFWLERTQFSPPHLNLTLSPM